MNCARSCHRLARMADGLARIAEIVRSMKEFSYADQREMSQVDLNRGINSTLDDTAEVA